MLVGVLNAVVAYKGYYDMIELIPAPLIVVLSLSLAGTCLFILVRSVIYDFSAKVSALREMRKTAASEANPIWDMPVTEAVKWVRWGPVGMSLPAGRDGEKAKACLSAINERAKAGQIRVAACKPPKVIHEQISFNEFELSASFNYDGYCEASNVLQNGRPTHINVLFDGRDIKRAFPR